MSGTDSAPDTAIPSSRPCCIRWLVVEYSLSPTEKR